MSKDVAEARRAEIAGDPVDVIHALRTELSRLQAALAAREDETLALRKHVRDFAAKWQADHPVEQGVRATCDYVDKLIGIDLGEMPLAARPTPADSGEEK